MPWNFIEIFIQAFYRILQSRFSMFCVVRENTFFFFCRMSRRYRDQDNPCKVYVGELGSGASKHDLEEAFSYYGHLRSVWIARNPPGFAFVEFNDPRDAEDSCRGLDGRLIIESFSARCTLFIFWKEFFFAKFALGWWADAEFGLSCPRGTWSDSREDRRPVVVHLTLMTNVTSAVRGVTMPGIVPALAPRGPVLVDTGGNVAFQGQYLIHMSSIYLLLLLLLN